MKSSAWYKGLFLQYFFKKILSIYLLFFNFFFYSCIWDSLFFLLLLPFFKPFVYCLSLSSPCYFLKIFATHFLYSDLYSNFLNSLTDLAHRNCFATGLKRKVTSVTDHVTSPQYKFVFSYLRRGRDMREEEWKSKLLRRSEKGAGAYDFS